MNTDNEDIGEEEDDAPTSVRASLDAVIDDSEDSELDDFEPDMYADKEDADDKASDDVSANENPASDDVSAKGLGTATDKPPLDWGVEVREHYKDLPDSVKAHLHARDQHVNAMLQDGAANRKMGEGLNNISQGYKAIMDAEGVTNPLQAVDGLFKSVATLRMGTMQEKADKIAQFCQVYGVDINALDNALVGKSNQNANATDPVAALIDERMAPVNQLLEQINQNRRAGQQQQEHRTAANIAEFAKGAEFIEDVRDDMADLLEGASNRGVKMSLQQAYDKACAINPEISNVLATRNTNAAMMGSRNNMAAKRNAASSINGNSGGPANRPSSGGLRGALESAFEDHT